MNKTAKRKATWGLPQQYNYDTCWNSRRHGRKKCTLLFNLLEYRVTGVSWLDEEERSERSDSKGPFLLSSSRLSSPSSSPFAARLWWKLGREEKGRKQQSVSLLWFSPSNPPPSSPIPPPLLPHPPLRSPESLLELWSKDFRQSFAQLSRARQPEVDFLQNSAVVSPWSLLYNSNDTKSIRNLSTSLPVADVCHSNTLFQWSAWSCDAHVFTKITTSSFSFVGHPVFS